MRRQIQWAMGAPIISICLQHLNLPKSSFLPVIISRIDRIDLTEQRGEIILKWLHVLCAQQMVY